MVAQTRWSKANLGSSRFILHREYYLFVFGTLLCDIYILFSLSYQCQIEFHRDSLTIFSTLDFSPHRVLFDLGCPRNNQIFFSIRTETNRNSICFSCFSVCFAKPKNIFFGLCWFDSVFRTCIETTETNRTLSKQTEKISKQRSLLGGPRNS